jgi:hypothetical protein
MFLENIRSILVAFLFPGNTGNCPAFACKIGVGIGIGVEKMKKPITIPTPNKPEEAA